MNVDLAQELLNALGSSLKSLETQHAALLQFLKDKGVLTDDQFAPYLEQAGKASSVRWRAAHVRLESLFSAERQKDEKREEDEKRQAATGGGPASKNTGEESKTKNDDDSARLGPWTAEAKINGANESPEKRTIDEKDSKLDEPASSEDKASQASNSA